MKNEINENKALSQTSVSGSAFLSGKCEVDFLNFYTQNRKYKNDLNQYKQNLQASIIIDWLDSKEFFVNIEVIKDKMLGYVRGFDSDVTFIMHGELTNVNSDCLKKDIYETRNEATLKAIQKASEIYNHIFCDFSQADR